MGASSTSVQLASSECLSVEGVGIHTGVTFRLRLFKNTAHRGLIFRVKRAEDVFEAPALSSRLSGTARATALVLRSLNSNSRERVELKTIEHFMAAFHVCGLAGFDVEIESVDNASDVSTGSVQPRSVFEVPILDGAAQDWMKLFHQAKLMRAGQHRMGAEDQLWLVARSFSIEHEGRRVELHPLGTGDNFENSAVTKYFCKVDFPDVWQQQAFFEVNWADVPGNIKYFSENIAPARTFGFEEELKDLEKRGLARGACLQNALLLSKSAVVNTGGFRVADELAAHKLLDLVGDFALAGAPIIGEIHAECAGHSMHLRAVTEAIRSGALIQGIFDRHMRFHRRD